MDGGDLILKPIYIGQDSWISSSVIDAPKLAATDDRDSKQVATVERHLYNGGAGP
jgi:hypothetical protein